MSPTPFADRLAALVDERHSQICLGLDPDPASLLAEGVDAAGSGPPAERAGRAVTAHCSALIERVGRHCVAVKLQLACFERLGPPGAAALVEVVEIARGAGLLVVADGKRGDVPVTAAAYAQALVGHTPTPWGPVAGLGADAFTANPLLGADSIEPLAAAAEQAGAGIFCLVRTSNPGAAEIQDLDAAGSPLHQRFAAIVSELGPRFTGSSGLSGAGAVVGATEPGRLGRLRQLLPHSIFLIPGVGAQGGRPQDLAPALAAGMPASILVAASRSIADAGDPARAADELRRAVWRLSS